MCVSAVLHVNLLLAQRKLNTPEPMIPGHYGECISLPRTLPKGDARKLRAETGHATIVDCNMVQAGGGTRTVLCRATRASAGKIFSQPASVRLKIECGKKADDTHILDEQLQEAEQCRLKLEVDSLRVSTEYWKVVSAWRGDNCSSETRCLATPILSGFGQAGLIRQKSKSTPARPSSGPRRRCKTSSRPL